MSKVSTLRSTDHTRGSICAPLLLTKYGSYLCPRSAEAHLTVQNIRQSLGDRLCFVFRHFPEEEKYPRAFFIAEAAEAAGAQGKFWEMHDRLFDNQKFLDDASVVELADEIDLEVPRFLREVGQHVYAQRVQSDIDQGVKDGVETSPTFFISVRHDGKEGLEPIVQQILDVVLNSSVKQ